MQRKLVNSQLSNWKTYEMYKRQMLTLAENVFEFENLPEINIHRTFFAKNFKYMLRGFRSIFRRFGSLNDFAKSIGAGKAEMPSWYLVEQMQTVFSEANNGTTD